MADEPRFDVNAHGPNVLDHFIGQSAAVAKVKVALEACWNDGVPFPHTLMVGPAGVGKTLLAKVIAKEMGSKLHEALAQTLEQPGDLNAVLLGAEDRDCVFLDECDELEKPFQTLLYRALEERKLFINQQRGIKGIASIPISNLTVLAATNHESNLVAPLRERFRMVLRFDYYSVEELAHVVRQRTNALRWPCDEEVCSHIAALGRGVPRLALRLLEACYRTTRSTNGRTITVDHFHSTCRLEGLDLQYGLDPTERRYLAILHEAQGKPVRIGTLSARLGLPPRTLSAVVETHLLRMGLLHRSETGRELTPLALEFLNEMNTADRSDA